MDYKIKFKSSVEKDFRGINHGHHRKMLDAIEELRENPARGKRLQGEFAGLCRLRAGDYRIIYSIAGDIITILRVAHRKEAYR